MDVTERKIAIPLDNGTATALVFEPAGACYGTVLLYHGLGASKEVQRKELGWLATAGLRGICVDAPHHGERNDGVLEGLRVLENPHPHFIKIVRDAAMEVPAIVDFSIHTFGGKVGISGISLGGFISYAAVPIEKRIAASVPILGSPHWGPRDGRKPTDELLLLMREAPVRHPDSFRPCALFAANAGKDLSVPPQASRDFLEELQSHYKGCEERLRYREFSESEHMMREEDWVALWQDAIGWFLKYLA